MYKVLVVTEEGRGGGAIGRIRIIAKELQGRIETIVLAPTSGKKYIQSLQNKDIPVVTTRIYPLTTNLIIFFKYVVCFLPEVWRIYRIIKRTKPDLVHCNGSWQIKGLIASKLARVKCVWQMNDTYQPSAVLFFFKVLAELPTAYIYASDKTKEYYSNIKSSLFQKTSTVIQAPVFLDRSIKERKHQLEKTPLRLVLVGYINHHKGIDILIQALSHYTRDEVTCDIVGPVIGTRADYKKGLDDLADRLGIELNYLGFQKITAELFEGYDFYCCSSRREASPMSVWEALSFGLPVIGTPVGDIQRIVSQYGCGLAVESISSEALVKAIADARGLGQAAYDGMSRNSLEAAKLFDHQEIADQYLRFYTKVIGGQS